MTRTRCSNCGELATMTLYPMEVHSCDNCEDLFTLENNEMAELLDNQNESNK